MKLSEGWPRSVKTWADVFEYIDSVNKSDKKRAGALFEIFCKNFFESVPKYANDFKYVWLGAAAPLGIKKKLGLEKKDVGYDLIAETKDGKIALIQCKFTSKQVEKKIGWTSSNLSSFLAAASKSDIKIIFTNASKVDEKVRRKASEKGRYYEFDLSHLHRLSENELNRILSGINKKRKPKKEKYRPHNHQRKAINKVVHGFKEADRGKLILPCGAGKTLTALWIKERMKAKKTLVLVPSLALLRQIKDDWKSQEKTYSSYLCVCSEDSIDKNRDELESSVFEIGGPVTTDPKEIRKFLRLNDNAIIYSTYQSSEKIQKALSSTNIKFDLAVCDEAHRTAGSRSSLFATILDNKKIPCRKRLFMTATPRVVGEIIERKGEDVIKLLADMNNSEQYGEELFRISFAEAAKIKPAILTDYKVIAIGVSDDEVRKAINMRSYVKGNVTINEVANNVALKKVMKKYKATHAITFHSTISRAKNFSERQRKLEPRKFIEYVSGKQSTALREDILVEFKESKSGVIANSRCLTEGVDVPVIDLVYFCDPKRSKIDIVQASGRALRVGRNKKKPFGYLVVPIFHKKKVSVDKNIKLGAFKDVVTVIRALANHDERIEEEIKQLVESKGEKGEQSDRLHIDLGKDTIVELEGFEQKLRKSIFSHIIRKTVPDAQWKGYEDARDFVRKLKLSGVSGWYNYCKSGKRPNDIPSNPQRTYREAGWISWKDWLGTSYVHGPLRKYKTFKEAKAFVRKLKLSTSNDWREYSKSGKRPNVGTKYVAHSKRKYKTFKDARDFVRKLNLSSRTDYTKYSKSGKRPNDIPSAPNEFYKNAGWKSWGDWFGTGYVHGPLRNYKSFKDARKVVRKLKLKSTAEWLEYNSSGKKPDDIPSNPRTTYRDSGWISMGDWLGTGYVGTHARSFRKFKSARDFVRKLKLSGQKDWNAYCKSGKIPNDIPTNPHRTYKDSGWISMGDWLGTGYIHVTLRKYKTFKEARAFVRKLKLAGLSDWRKYCKSGKKPDDIPSAPWNTYKNDGWDSAGDWLGTKYVAHSKRKYKTFGTKYVAHSKRKYKTFNDARAFIRKLNLSSQTDWSKYCKSGKKPNDIPSTPSGVYKNAGWISWGDWFGTEYVASQHRSYRKFKSARSFVRKLKLSNRIEWREYSKSGMRPNDIPSAPWSTYKDSGWVNMKDWLGTS